MKYNYFFNDSFMNATNTNLVDIIKRTLNGCNLVIKLKGQPYALYLSQTAKDGSILPRILNLDTDKKLWDDLKKIDTDLFVWQKNSLLKIKWIKAQSRKLYLNEIINFEFLND